MSKDEQENRAKDFYRRHLPHFNSVGRDVFVTWNLKGSLPGEALERQREERRGLEAALDKLPKSITNAERPNLLLDHARKVFSISETFLDRAETGPKHLADPDVAALVRDCIVAGAGQWYSLFAFVVMPNHVHLLIRPGVELERITRAIKRQTSKEINRRMGTPGVSVWQDESFDHFLRDAGARDRITAYIERNPVKAGLCARDEDWSWSSGAMRENWPRGTAYEQTMRNS